MFNYHNVRNSQGKFTRSVARASNGKFASPIKANCLYDYRGTTVRAQALRDPKKRTRFVSFHKTLFGFVPERELKKIDKTKVEKYLEKA